MTANDLTLTHTRPAIGDDVSLWTDHNRRRRIALESPEDFIDLLCDRFPLVPRSYVALYLERTIVEHHIENPLIERYLEAELGSIAKYRELIRGFAAQGFQIAGQSVLDIGCSNGALPLACLGEGAASAMGIDVSPGRLDSAAVLCSESDVRLACVDIVTEPLTEQFDVIFCTDVLEHVESADAALGRIAVALRDSAKAFAYVTVFNRNAMSNVLEEPHFSVPGLIRLGAKDGQRVWDTVRSAYHSQLDYGVFDWHDYSEYAEMAERHGLVVEPCYSEYTIQQSRAHEMAQFEEAAAHFEREFAERRLNLPLPDADLQLLDAAAREYVREFRRDHAGWSQGDREATRRIFLKYYAQPISFMMRHRGFPPPRPIEPKPPVLPRIQRLRQWVHDRPRLARIARAVRSILFRMLRRGAR